MKTAFIIPGQGAQCFGMGKDFYNEFKESRHVFECASDVLHLDLRKICFEENELLHITEYTQAALLTTCISIYEIIKKQGIIPDISAGLSLGEYGALYVCGAYGIEDAVTCVRKRGLYMQDAVPLGQGAMSAVIGMETEHIEELCAQIDGQVSIANYNCPGQVVITGETAAVKKAGMLLKNNGALRVVPLNVSGPFHSPMLRTAGERLGEVLKTIHWKCLDLPYVANVSGEPVYDIANVEELLIKQVSSPVKWQQSVETMIAQGVTQFVEIGPGNTLKKFIKKISKAVTVINISKTEDLQNLSKLEGTK